MSAKTVYSVELQQHVRYIQTTVSELKDGDKFVLFFSDLGEGYRIALNHRDASGAVWYTSTGFDGHKVTKSILLPTTPVYKVL